MPVFGTPRQVHEKFKFIVEIDFIENAAFSKCSELSVETAKIEYWEGGQLIPIKDPGRLTFSDVTLERGASQSVDFLNWAKDVADATIGPGGSGLPAPTFKRNLAVVQRERDNSELRRWNIFNAFPTKFTAGEWDNTVDEVVIEMMTLTYDFFELEQ